MILHLASRQRAEPATSMTRQVRRRDEHPRKTLKLVVDFLDLPDWEPKGSDLREKVNKGKYEQRIDPAIRWRLEEYFEPHNQRLYEFLGVDFGW